MTLAGLDRGSPLLGVFLKSPDPDGARIVAAAGLDFAIVDLEHSTLGVHEAGRLVSVLADVGVAPIVRLAEPDAVTAARVLEAGAAAIQLSSVTSTAQVQLMRAALEFPPRGTRGASFAHRQANWGFASVDAYTGSQRPSLVIQIESATTTDPLADIMAAGADAVFIGVEDLRLSCAAAQVDLSARCAEIVEAATRAQMPWGQPAPADGITELAAQGATIFTIGADRAIYAAALADRVRAARP